MKILLHMCSGAGDLIYITGALHYIKAKYPHLKLDFLCKKEHRYILENNPNLENILALEDYFKDGIGKFYRASYLDEYDREIEKKFKNDYSRVLSLSSIRDFSGPRFPPFTVISYNDFVITRHGLPLNTPLSQINPIFYYGREDYVKARDFYKKIKEETSGDFSICLFEDHAVTYKEHNQKKINEILKVWMKSGYINNFLVEKKRHITVGNDSNNDFVSKELNIKQLKLFFEKHCDCYFGMFSGITAGLTALPSDFINKKAITNAPRLPDVENHYPYLENGYVIKEREYSLKDSIDLLNS